MNFARSVCILITNSFVDNMILNKFKESNQYNHVTDAFAAECSVNSFAETIEISFLRIFISDRYARVLSFSILKIFDKYLIFEISLSVCRTSIRAV